MSTAAVDICDTFHVQASMYFYQPTPIDVLEKTGVEGTHIISPNPLILFSDPDYVDAQSRMRMRKQWLEGLEDSEFKDQHYPIGTAFVKAAACPVPSEYVVNLPIARKFKKDPVYGEMFWRGTNAASFEDVVNTLVPFAKMRKMIFDIQKSIVTPLHHIQFTAQTKGVAIAVVQPRAQLQ